MIKVLKPNFRSGHKLLLQQQELEKRMREYNDYHSKQIQNNQSLSPNSVSTRSAKDGSDKSQLIVQNEKSQSNSQNTVNRQFSFAQNSGKSRLEITSREVSFSK